MDYKDILNIEKCFKEEKIVVNDIAHLRQDLTREVIKISFGIRFFLTNNFLSVSFDYNDLPVNHFNWLLQRHFSTWYTIFRMRYNWILQIT